MVTPIKTCELDIVLDLLNKEFTKSQIREKLSISSTALSNRLRRLEDLGCIERSGKHLVKVLRSSHKNPRVTRNQIHIKLNKRGHAHNFKVYFPKEINLKEKPKVIVEKKLKQLQELPFGSLKFIKNKYTIWINKDSLTIYSNNSYYSSNALYSKFQALKDVDNLVKELKERFGLTGIYGIEIFREHYGLIFNKFAEWINKRGKKMSVQDKGNKSILWVDNSMKDDIGLNEFEGSDPLAINNADTFFSSHDKTNWKNDANVIENNKSKLKDHDLIINKSMNVLEGYAKQIALHLQVEQKQLSNLKDQNKIFRELRDFIKLNAR